MAGIYLHVPFCKKACHYCNFHFSTTLNRKGEMVAALLSELDLRRDYLSGAPLRSVYLGGGTPSLLETKELVALFEKIAALHTVLPEAEITIEANPDDLDENTLREWREHTPINRISIGVQSFFDDELAWMNRSHNAEQSIRSIENARKLGFDNLTIDLIYGTPISGDERWEANLEQAKALDLPHLSCYSLTVEERTALAHFVRTGRAPAVDEEAAARQFEILMDFAEAEGYEHYEISNFARPGRRAVHNSAYWQNLPYLGIGPSAHSFDGVRRQYNIAHNARYIAAIGEGRLPAETESLNDAQRYNETVLTALRLTEGLDIRALPPSRAAYFAAQIAPWLNSGHVREQKGRYALTRSGKLLADRIATDVFAADA